MNVSTKESKPLATYALVRISYFLSAGIGWDQLGLAGIAGIGWIAWSMGCGSPQVAGRTTEGLHLLHQGSQQMSSDCPNDAMLH